MTDLLQIFLKYNLTNCIVYTLAIGLERIILIRLSHLYYDDFKLHRIFPVELLSGTEMLYQSFVIHFQP
jgi:hypothetical protein